MQGFKSFADPVSIEFNKGVTCIIGPNGSGKSNISDALRWVLGEQSSKQLRGGKMQDVIFAGTNARKPKGMAEVTLVIDNTTGILPIEYTEVAVTRRMYRSGESEYLINGNQCRLKDIKELFMDTGIGVDGYSIIGQGKIAEIVSTKPENRRQIFEEAAGVVLYKSRKSDAENKLKAASDNLERIRDIIAEIESRIGGLKEESEKAAEYIVLRDKYKKLGINIIIHNLDGLAKSVEAGKTDLEELGKTFEDLQISCNNLEDTIEQKRISDAELNDKLNNANEKLLAKIEELNTISNSGQLNAEKLANIEKELTRINSEIEEDTSKLSDTKSELDELIKKDNELKADKDSADNAHREAVIKLNEDTAKYNNLSSEIENSKERIIELNNSNVKTRAEITTLDNYVKTLSDRKESLAEEFLGRDEKDALNKSQLAGICTKLEAKSNELEDIKLKLSDIESKIESNNLLAADSSKEIDNLTAKLNMASARKSTIEEMEHNYEGYNNAVRQIMHKSFSGIIGTVSDLIDVPAGYEIAIETALGSNLQNIVCKSDSDAKSAIAWLKSAKAGRATFLPIESVHADRLSLDSSIKNAKGFIGIASEIVSCDSKYKQILEYLLCRVILAENMDNAVAISKLKASGFRIVTLDGEVVNSFGAITGGKYANKSANLLDRKKEIQELSLKISEYEASIKSLKEKKEALNKENIDILRNKTELNDKLQQQNIEYNVLLADKEHAKALVDEAKTASSKYDNELKVIEGDIADAEAMVSKYQEAITAAEAEASKLEEDIALKLEELEKLKSICENDNESIVSYKMQLTEQETKIYAQNEMVERIKDTIYDIQSELDENNEAKQELEITRNLLSSTGVESTEKETELKEEKMSLEKEIAELGMQIDQNKLEHDEAIKTQRESSRKLDQLRDDKFRLELRLSKNETLLETQKDKLWDEFEVSYAEALDMRDENFSITQGNRESKEIKLRMAELGDVNISSIEEYSKVSSRYEFLTAQEADTSKAMKELQEIISNMDHTIKVKFKENFDKVVVLFEETFKELFGGGYAELRLEDETRPLESGIEITAQPPGKKLKNINLLSGGEKTLTAIALMFAVLKAKPTPFCILDEVEAALDEVNIERFSNYLHQFEDVQFALITHQKATMEHADVLYGVTMPEQGISKMLSLKIGDEFDVEGLE